MPFERFVSTGRRLRATMSVTKSGRIAFGEGIVRRFGLRSFKYAVLFYDREKSVVGVMPTNDDAEDGAVRIYQLRWGVEISATAFLSYYGIEYRETTRYDATWDGERGMIVAELKKGS